MQNRSKTPISIPLLALAAASSALGGCEAVKGIFKAGVWTGVIAVVIVLGLIMALFGRSKAA